MSIVQKRGLGQWLALLALILLVAGGNLACGLIGPQLDKLTLLVSGNALAYVKNCGCATGQTGGVLRQMRVARQEHESLVNEQASGTKSGVLLLETGNFSDPSTSVKRIESEMVVHSLVDLDYQVVGLGSKELTWPQQDLLALLSASEMPLTCANLKFVAPKASVAEDKSSELNALIKPYRLIPMANGFTVGVIHAIQTGPASELGALYGYQLERPATAVEAILAAHAAEAHYWVLTLSDGDALGSTPGGLEKLSQLAVIIGLSGSNPLPGHNNQAVRPVFVPAPFHKAKDLLRVQQFFAPGGKLGVVNAESLALRADVKFDEKLAKVWDGMQLKLQQLAADEANALILARANAKPPFHVGQNNCIECHKEIVDKLARSKHASAYVTLVEKQVETNASCVKCHVVGYGAPWGWNVKENQPNLQGVQCENCHGPASYHLDLYKKKQPPADLMAEGRDKFGLLPAGETNCIKCHDPDNSPNFSFSSYWAKIEH